MKVFSFLSFLTIFSISTQVAAQSAIDARMEYESWNSGINGKTSALLYGIGGSTMVNRQWSLSGGIVVGEHTFADTENASASRQDADVVVAYQLMPRIRVYSGYRLIRIEYKNEIDNTRSFTDLTHGLGVGVAAYHRVMPKLFAIGRVGASVLYSSVDFSENDDTGTGFGSGFEAGLIYQVLATTNVGFSVKQQGTVISYKNDSDKWNHNYLRLGMSLSHTF